MTDRSPITALTGLPAAQDSGRALGLTSVCSAHPLVIEAALVEARAAGLTPVIEATCNQVNQEGGYTGLTPAAFRDRVAGIAAGLGIDPGALLFGGDHLGPNPWRHLPAGEAMARAEVMTRAYAAAGYQKIHLDASMACAGDPVPLPAEVIATRAARLAVAAEAGARDGGHPAPAYIVGTEVPVPGGAAEEALHVTVTTTDHAAETLALHDRAFRDVGLERAVARIVAIVVQPGVEFGQVALHRYDPPAAAALRDWRQATGGVVFEAHSTDYQDAAALAALVADGFAILKVGPGLTFALREALYGLDLIAAELCPDRTAGQLPQAMERLMQAHPGTWQPYVSGDGAAQRLQRHYGLSDRIRYLWPEAEAEAAVADLMAALGAREIPWPLVSQHLGRLADRVAAGEVACQARPLLIAAVRAALAPYSAACLGR